MDYKKGILIAFGELFLKSDNVRKIFQRRLINNLRFFLNKEKIDFKVISSRERVFIKTEEIKKASKIIKRVFGITWLGESFYFNNLKELLSFIDKNYQNYIKKGETFAIRMKKDRKIIDRIAKNIDRKVDLNKPKRELFVEKRGENYFLYFKKIRCLGGLPSGSSGKVLCLISGGIDSPPAAFLAAKRGGENVWLHFHSFPLVSNSSIEKVKELAKSFLKYQPNLKVYFVPFQKAQLEIKAKTPAKYRVLLYRRLMLKIAEKIAQKENCQALITGESLGQVSSQTLFNIKIIEESVKIPILRPLIGWDKQEIISLAKKIKTYNISIKPQEDCCTLFVPKHQTAQGNIDIVKKLEKKIKIPRLDYDLYLI
jgi:thiamine biosynthesis protein ThiI